MSMFLTYSTYKNDVWYGNRFSVMLKAACKCMNLKLTTMHHNIIVIQVLGRVWNVIFLA